MLKKLLFILCLIPLMIHSNNLVSATMKDDRLTSKEVINKASVIVRGKFDFSFVADATVSTYPLKKTTFSVKHTYKGEVPSEITVGIDDVDYAEEFQENGGEFLLLLKMNEDLGYYTPYLRGEVYIKDGEVINQEVKDKEIFEEYLDKNKNTNSMYFYLIIFTILLFIFISYSLYRKNRVREI